MQSEKVAQGGRLGNQAEFVPGPRMNTNQRKNLHWLEHFRVHH